MPKIWRIACAVALVVCTGIAVLFGHEIFVRGNDTAVDNLSRFHPNPAVEFALVELLIATFLIGLITFPYYWFQWMAFLLRGRSAEDPRALARGAAVSFACVLVAIWLALIVLDLDGLS